METSTILAFIIAIIFFVLYYFRGQEIIVRKNREAVFKKESETLQLERELLFRKEIEAIQSKLNDTYKRV